MDDVRREIAYLKARIAALESRLDARSTPVAKPAPVAQPVPEAAAVSHPAVVSHVAERPHRDLETTLGRYWLNKIGIVLFALGVAFFIGYTFQYLGAFAKILIGYLISAALFVAGAKLERKPGLTNYGYVLLGGAWAIAYFTTYAMHHFEASRIIQNEAMDLVLVACVAAGMLMHALKYRSEALATVALGVGFFTATLGDVGLFTLWCTTLLAAAAVALMRRMGWVRMICWGIAATYAVQYVWLYKQIAHSTFPVSALSVHERIFRLNVSFLSLYWAIFALGVLLLKRDVLIARCRNLVAAVYGNAVVFAALVFMEMSRLHPDARYHFLMGMGVVYLAMAWVMERRQARVVATAHLLAGLALVTVAIPLRWAWLTTTLVWQIETPLLCALGILARRPVVRYAALVLAGVVMTRYGFIEYFSHARVDWGSVGFGWNTLLAAVGGAGCAFIYRLQRYGYARHLVGETEWLWRVVPSMLATGYLLLWTRLAVPAQFFTLVLAAYPLCLLAAGYRYQDRLGSWYSCAVFAFFAVRFCFIEDYTSMGLGARAAALAWVVAASYGLYLMRVGIGRRQVELPETHELVLDRVVLVVAFGCLMAALFSYVSVAWLSLSLGLAGVAMFAAGFLTKDRDLRIAGFAAFAVTVARVFLKDMAALPAVVKIISFIIVGLLFLGISYFYTRTKDK